MPMRQVCGLDVHKDSVFACILNENGVIFQEKFGVLTPEVSTQVYAKVNLDKKIDAVNLTKGVFV